ncbi:multicopper oxidase domain-containing protein [Ditylenchus destructor]|uniref:Copper-containing nitrite reductase n=1 Tax=Ditylenchus destructor TaxID=166010 RepID=A0AAD4MRF4_9BILA|nr:multicopper oxidase domain-containing protein [Ditylenchus destructor]
MLRSFARILESNISSKRSIISGLKPKCYQATRYYSNETKLISQIGSKSRKYYKAAFGSGVVLAGAAGTFMNLLKDPNDGSKPSAQTQSKFTPEVDFLPHIEDLPRELAPIVLAPNVPPPIKRDHPARVHVKMDTSAVWNPVTRQFKYKMWTFNGGVPGPFIRAREGDVLEIEFANKDEDGLAHNIDFHAVTGPGGGAPLLFAEQDETKHGYFRLLYPGLYLYHCAAAPIPQHIANGMYGLILVEPKGGLPPVDKEFYVMQSEFYTEPVADNPKTQVEYSYVEGLNENAQYVVFNGREGSLTDNPLMARVGEKVRLYFGNAGPNLCSSFHVIGTIFDKVYRDGGLISAPDRGLAMTLVPPGGTTVVEMDAIVPGTYTLVDHAIHRIDKGAVGFLKVAGKPRPDIYEGTNRPVPCPGCKLHE